MSIEVDLGELRARLAGFGPTAFLVTVSPEGSPHVVSVAAVLDGDELVMTTGRGTRRNATSSPAVTLVWPGGDGDYCLLVDGVARVLDAEVISVQPTSAVLHRLADASADLPSCVPLDDRAVTKP